MLAVAGLHFGSYRMLMMSLFLRSRDPLTSGDEPDYQLIAVDDATEVGID